MTPSESSLLVRYLSSPAAFVGFLVFPVSPVTHVYLVRLSLTDAPLQGIYSTRPSMSRALAV